MILTLVFVQIETSVPLETEVVIKPVLTRLARLRAVATLAMN